MYVAHSLPLFLLCLKISPSIVGPTSDSLITESVCRGKLHNIIIQAQIPIRNTNVCLLLCSLLIQQHFLVTRGNYFGIEANKWRSREAANFERILKTNKAG